MDKVSATRFSLILWGHILNPLFPGHRERRYKAYDRILTAYMKENWLKSADRIMPREVDRNGDEKIFTIWFQGEENAPDIVKSCFKSIREHCPEELVVLDSNSLWDWISLPEEIVEKYRGGKIKHAHFADICRVELLYRYGGYWLDSTCFVSAPVPEYIKKQDFFMFMAGKRVHGNYSYVQNCFIRARKGSYLLEAWREMILDYWMHEDRRVDYFMHQLMFRTLVTYNPTAAYYFAKMPGVDQYPTHLYLYEFENKPYEPGIFEKAAQEGFFYQKTRYKGTENPVPGSFMEYLVNYWKNA